MFSCVALGLGALQGGGEATPRRRAELGVSLWARNLTVRACTQASFALEAANTRAVWPSVFCRSGLADRVLQQDEHDGEAIVARSIHKHAAPVMHRTANHVFSRHPIYLPFIDEHEFAKWSSLLTRPNCRFVI